MATYTFSEQHGDTMRQIYGWPMTPPPQTTSGHAEAPPPAAEATTESPPVDNTGSAPVANVTPETPEPAPEPEPEPPPDEEEPAAAPEEPDETPTEPSVPQESLSPGIQKRFDRFTRRVRGLERENLTLEAQLSQERAKNETLTQLLGQAPTTPRPASPTPPAQETLLREDDFPTYGEYLHAVVVQEAERISTAKIAEVLEQQRQEAHTQAQLSQRQTQLQQQRASVAAAKARYADYDEVLGAVRDIPTSQALVDAVQESPVLGELSYYLASHLEDVQRLSQIQSPTQLSRELGKLEARLSAEEPASVSSDAPSRARPAPGVPPPPRLTPMRPVGGQSNTQPVLDWGKVPFKDYEKKREREEAARRR
jgi:hypothetical protein